MLLVTNATDLPPEQVIERYKSLADIERGFRVLKSEIEIGPVHRRLPDRIHAHAMICFMALILYRVMRARLRASRTSMSPERGPSLLRRVQHHRAKLPDDKIIEGISSMTTEQTDILSAIGASKPDKNRQLSLL